MSLASSIALGIREYYHRGHGHSHGADGERGHEDDHEDLTTTTTTPTTTKTRTGCGLLSNSTSRSSAGTPTRTTPTNWGTQWTGDCSVSSGSRCYSSRATHYEDRVKKYTPYLPVFSAVVLIAMGSGSSSASSEPRSRTPLDGGCHARTSNAVLTQSVAPSRIALAARTTGRQSGFSGSSIQL